MKGEEYTPHTHPLTPHHSYPPYTPPTRFMLIMEALWLREALSAASGVLSPRPSPRQSISPPVGP